MKTLCTDDLRWMFHPFTRQAVCPSRTAPAMVCGFVRSTAVPGSIDLMNWIAAAADGYGRRRPLDVQRKRANPAGEHSLSTKRRARAIMQTPALNFSTPSPWWKRLLATTIFASLALSCPVPAHELEFWQVENLTVSGLAHLIPNSPASNARVYSKKTAIADIDLTTANITALKQKKVFELYESEIVVDFCSQDLARKNRRELVLALEGPRRWP